MSGEWKVERRKLLPLVPNAYAAPVVILSVSEITNTLQE